MNRKLTLHDHVKIHTCLSLGGAAITVIGGCLSSFENHHPLLWIGVTTMVISVVYRLLTIKCPHCGSSLLYSRVLEYCPNCGEKLL